MSEQIVRNEIGIGRVITKKVTPIERATPNIISFESRLYNTEQSVNSMSVTLSQKLNANVYTPSDILTKIKTVDGTGSGLDADLLDGYQAAHFELKPTWKFINSAYVINLREHLMVDTSSSSFIVQLPNTPVLGSHIKIIDHAGTFETNNLIISGNGKKIMGLSENLVCEMNNIEFNLFYSDTTQGWKIGN